jgi:L-asparagine transporter-like permease
VFVLLISLFLLIPQQEQQSIAIEIGVAGALGLIRFVRRIRAFSGRSDPFGGWVYVLRRLGLPAAASIGLLIIAASIVSNPVSSLYWLLAMVLVFLTSAADSSWDLLIEVGRERRRAH